MSEKKHSPLPWATQEESYRVTSSGQVICGIFAPSNPETVEAALEKMAADAELIVRAVNSHDVLLAACKAAAERGYTFGDLGDPAVEMPSRETLIKWSEDMFSLYIECQAALDKATGLTGNAEEEEDTA